MIAVINFFQQNWSLIGSGLFAIVLICSIIVKLTPNTRDDGLLSKVIGALDKFSVAKTAHDKELLQRARDLLGLKR